MPVGPTLHPPGPNTGTGGLPTHEVAAFVLDMAPVQQNRPRARCIGGKARMYSDQAKIKGAISTLLAHAWRRRKPIAAPVCLSLLFCMPRPKSRKVKDIEHTKKPDLSNMVKMVEDCGNGIIWRDDSLIYEIFTRKIYSDYPCVKVEVKWQSLPTKPPA